MFGNRFKYITLTILLVIIKAQDFSPGPYGINFLDIAGPFILEDLNVRQTEILMEIGLLTSKIF